MGRRSLISLHLECGCPMLETGIKVKVVYVVNICSTAYNRNYSNTSNQNMHGESKSIKEFNYGEHNSK